MKFAVNTILNRRAAARLRRVGRALRCAPEPAPDGVDACRGFTLVEVLAALLFMAIVIPVAVQGLQIASKAGEVAQRKAEAARVAERILNETIVTTNWSQSSQTGTEFEGQREFRWTLDDEPWSQASTNQVLPGQSASGLVNTVQPMVDTFTAGQILMDLLTVEVTYTVQNQDYSVRLSTLVPTQ